MRTSIPPEPSYSYSTTCGFSWSNGFSFNISHLHQDLNDSEKHAGWSFSSEVGMLLNETRNNILHNLSRTCWISVKWARVLGRDRVMKIDESLMIPFCTSPQVRGVNETTKQVQSVLMHLSLQIVVTTWVANGR